MVQPDSIRPKMRVFYLTSTGIEHTDYCGFSKPYSHCMKWRQA